MIRSPPTKPHQLSINRASTQQFRITQDHQVLPCTSKRNIQFAVNAFVGEGYEALELARGVGAKRNQNHVACAALIAFYRVNGEEVEGEVLFGEFFADLCDLGAVGRNDANATHTQFLSTFGE